MDIYLDIDGTIKNTSASQEDVIVLLEYCLNRFDVYWLTTHCRNNINRTYEALDFLPEAIRERAFYEIAESNWNTMKTEGINFRNKFVWLDDTILQAEMKVLEQNRAEMGFFRVETKNPDCLKEALAYIKAMEECI